MTIDDAIKALEHRASTGHPEEDCSDFSFGAPIQVVNEALYMAIDALRAQQEQENPKPLTLDELREMVGKPVWVQSPGMPEYGRWAIVEGVDIEQKILWLRADYTCHDYGKVWLAYRHKPMERSSACSHRKCSSFVTEYGKTVCYGTKEREECTCGGDESKCNFYKRFL